MPVAIYLTCVRYNLFDIETSLTADTFIYSAVNMLLEMSFIETQDDLFRVLFVSHALPTFSFIERKGHLDYCWTMM